MTETENPNPTDEQSTDNTERYVPEGWKANPTARGNWDWALYNQIDPYALPHNTLESLRDHYHEIRVESDNRLRVMVRSQETEVDQ
jgi:hypothetical protein